jgi:hypothetical protein
MIAYASLHRSELVASLGLFAIELGILSLASRAALPAVVLAAMHTLVVAAVALWAWRCPVPTARYQWLLVLTTAACGPLGPLGVGLAMLHERRRAVHARSLEAWHETLFPPTGPDQQAELWRRIGQRASDRPADQRVTPFLDVLTFGSVQQRQAVVGIIAMQFKPAFAAALKLALRDPHNVVRVQAATAIARLEHEFLERTVSLEAAVSRAPQDAEAILALASHYDDQAFNGLLDEARAQECRTKAVGGYEDYLRQRPGDAGVELKLARLLLRQHQPAAAESRLRRLVDDGHRGARLWLMESLFVQRKYAEMRRLAQAAADEVEPSLAFEVDEALGLWAGREAVAR